MIALDAVSGSPVWEPVTIDQSKPYSITGAPRIVKGMVLIGNGIRIARATTDLADSFQHWYPMRYQ